MGQCSTLPSDAHNSGGGGGGSSAADPASPTAPTSRSKRQSAQSSPSYRASQQQTQVQAHQPQQRDDHDGSTRDVVMADAAAAEARPYGGHQATTRQQQNAAGSAGGAGGLVNVSKNASSSSRRRVSSQPTSESASGSSYGRDGPAVVLPPDAAERKRCYRLNLEVPSGLSSFDPASGQTTSGPHVYEPPPHHLPQSSSSRKNFRKSHSWHSATAGMTALQVSNSDDADSTGSSAKSATAVAISTAQIFRGITVDRNGTILTQNARASRSSSKNKGGDKKKVGEKSRQAAKIDKAKDLVDDAVNGASAVDGEPAKMVSLVIMGDYDDMKHLVRDGSKKLRDASNLPDDALLSLNRQRTSSASYAGSGAGMHGTPPISPANRKRISPYGQTGNGTTPPIPTSGSKSRMSRNQSTAHPSSAPPKLKAHPRDRNGAPSSRRLGGGGGGDGTENEGGDNANKFVNNQCNDMPIFGGPRDSDWSDALNFSTKFHSIWNCGATGGGGGSSNGTMSPTNPASPTRNNKNMSSYVAGGGGGGGGAMPMTREGRNESAYRGGGDRSERVDAMGNAVA